MAFDSNTIDGRQTEASRKDSTPANGRVGLPLVLNRFLFGSAALTGLAWVTITVCRYVFHLTYPYDRLFLEPWYDYHDYWMFTDRFHLFHSVDFFIGHAKYVFSYPAPMAIFYKATFVLTHESTAAFLAFMVIGFIVAGVLFARELIREGVEAKSAALLVGGSLVLSGPIWFELNRANLEFYVWIVLMLGVWLFFKDKGYGAAACFGIAGSMKLFPFVYLGLLLSQKKYKQVAFGIVVAVVTTVISLWLVCPDVGLAWHMLNENANKFGRMYLYQRLWREVGFDHSLFALIKMLWRKLPGPAVMSHVLSTYMAVCALGGILLYFLRIRRLPMANQLVCLTVASVLFPPSSSDYTLIHLYAPWAVLVLIAFRAQHEGRALPGLWPAFVCLIILLSPEAEFYFRHERGEGMIKAVALLALGWIALRYPLDGLEREESDALTVAA